MALGWLDPLHYAYSSGGDVAALTQAQAILLDFAASHPTADLADRVVWERKRAGDRLLRIIYALRAGACEGTLDESQAQALLVSARRHAAFLSAQRDTPRRSNHDLDQDLALMAVGRYLPFLDKADAWYRDGRSRFKHGIAVLVDRDTGIYLEQTASYQALGVDRLTSFIDLARGPEHAYQRLLERMRDVASWLVMPDGTFAPLGDTPFVAPAPDYALADSGQDMGLSPTLGSGFEMVKEPGSFLATTAGHHRPIHKQADELSFDLYECGRRVIVDSGRYDPGRGPAGAKGYTLSSQAHSTVTVDGTSFPLHGNFYGSALSAAGSGDGWYAIEGHNPLLAAQHVSHRRLFLYKPGVALVIVDRLRSKRPHTYGRFFQIAPELAATLNSSGATLSGSGGFEATIWSGTTPGSRSPRLFNGRHHPLRGWYAPSGISTLQPRDSVEFRARSRRATLVATVGIGADAITATATQDGADVELPGGAERVTVQRVGATLAVSATPLP